MNPIKRRDVEVLKHAQRIFTKRQRGLIDMLYEDRLNVLAADKLETVLCKDDCSVMGQLLSIQL